MSDLTTSDRRFVRPPLWLVKVGVTAVIGVGVMAEMLLEPLADPLTSTRAAIGSTAYLATGLQITLMGLALLVWHAPRTALGVLAVVGSVIPLGQTSLGLAWPAVGLVAAATLAVLFLPRTDSAPHASVGVPQETWAQNSARSGVLLGGAAVVASLVVFVGALVWHARDAADTLAFEARALPMTATAVSRADDGWVFQIGDRQVTRLAPRVAEMRAGLTFAVLVDPDDPERLSFLADPKDPSWLVGVAGLAPTLLGAGLGRLLLRRRQDTLVLRGGPSRRAMLRSVGEAGYELLPLGAQGGPAFTVEGLSLAHLPSDYVTLPGYGPLRWHEDPSFVGPDGSPSEWEDEEDEPDAPVPDDPRELAAWADGYQEDLATMEPEGEGDLTGPLLLHDVEITVVGRLIEGDPVALRLDDGRVYLGVLTIPWRAPRPRRPVVKGSAASWASEPEFQQLRTPESLVEHTQLAVTDWLRARGRVLRWVALPVALAAAFAGVWLVEGADWAWWEWLRFGLAALVLLAAPIVVSGWLSADGVCRDKHGFRILGVFVDEVVGSANVETVTAGERSVAVRLREPDDALSLDPACFYEDGRPSPSVAAALIREWVDRAGPQGRSGWRPTPGLLGIGVILVVWAATAVRMLLG